MAHHAEDTRIADRLWADYARTHDPRTREAIVHQFERLAYSIANKFARRGVDNEDLVQVALVGLVKAVDRFDPKTNFRFSTFATPTILGELKRYFRDHSWTLHVPRGTQELAVKVERASRDLSERLGQAPTAAELATHLGVTEEAVVEALNLPEVNHTLSLDRELTPIDGDRPTLLEQYLGREDTGLKETDYRLGLRQALHHLSAQLQEIVQLRYFAELSQRAVARRLGLSQMQVSRMERRALEQLRTHFVVN
jgi:RNA polymerase sigma-B factor